MQKSCADIRNFLLLDERIGTSGMPLALGIESASTSGIAAATGAGTSASFAAGAGAASEVRPQAASVMAAITEMSAMLLVTTSSLVLSGRQTSTGKAEGKRGESRVMC